MGVTLGSDQIQTLICFLVGEAGCEGFAWYAVTEGREEVVTNRDDEGRVGTSRDDKGLG